MSFAFAVPDVAASVTAFYLKQVIPLTCHQAGTTAEAPASMVGDVVRFVNVMRPVEMRKFHLLNLQNFLLRKFCNYSITHFARCQYVNESFWRYFSVSFVCVLMLSKKLYIVKYRQVISQ